MKAVIRKGLKLPVILQGLLKPDPKNGCYFLAYHSISGQLNLELDLPIPLFRRQLQFLAQTKKVVHYSEALAALQLEQPTVDEAFVLTFDDGYLNFYTHVFPLLCDLELPATVFVSTNFIETGILYPTQPDRSTNFKPVTWDMLAEMAASGLVTVGAHTHTHPILPDEPETRVIEELVKPIELVRQRLGIELRHFAYPWGRWSPQVELLVARYYASAVIGGGQKATSDSFNPYQIPRLPIRRSDGWSFFLAKVRGWMAGEERLYNGLRHLKPTSSPQEN